MHSILRGLLVLATAAGFVVPAVASAPRRAVSPGAPAAPQKLQFTASQLEYYLDDAGISYIRPGLNIKVNSVTIGSDNKALVDLNLTDDMGQPLDRNGQLTPGAVSISCVLAYYDPATRQYTAYTVRTVTGAPGFPGAGNKATQATSDSGGKWTDLASGWSKYTFATALPANFDKSKTTTLGIYATRNLTSILGKNYYANVEYDFRPDGAAVVDKWDKINTAASCNNCHDPLAMHGGSRRDAKLCSLCHQPQSTDPESGNTVDLKVMAHKIHMGSSLPSVKAGTPYQIVGFQNSVSDFSSVVLPMDVRNCDRCHSGTNASAIPTQSNVWYTNPTRAACGSCHDDINWATGANHVAGPMADDKACADCHTPDSGKEFDASIKGAHVIPTKSKQLKGLSVTIASVSNFKAGAKPTVSFAIKNADGSAVDGTKLTSFAPIFAGPTGSYSTYYREAAQKTATFDASTGLTTYTFTNALPADASGTWTISADTYRSIQLLKADGSNLPGGPIREAAMNPIKYVALTGTVTPRRMIVALANCTACHESLGLHGGQRQTTEECVICHNPTEGDQARRPADQGAKESVSFQRLIHRIHTGENLTQDFTIFGFGGSKNNFNEVRFPGDTRDCAKCHVNNSYTLPVATSAASVTTLRDYFSPQGPGTAACLGCHDNKDAAAHAYLNTTTFPGANAPQEACATCHGTGKDWDAAKVHAR